VILELEGETVMVNAMNMRGVEVKSSNARVASVSSVHHLSHLHLLLLCNGLVGCTPVRELDI
jgi:hypothetical protein